MIAHTCNTNNFGKTRLEDHFSPGVSNQSGHHRKTLHTKDTKLARHGGAHMQSQLPGRLRQDNSLSLELHVTVSYDGTTALQPAGGKRKGPD